jgi:hypothetical protein
MCAGTGLRLCRRSLKRSRRKALDKCRIGLVTLRGIRYGHVTELKRLLPEADLVEFDPSFAKFGKSVARKNLIYLRRSGFLTHLACIALEQRLHPGMKSRDSWAHLRCLPQNGGDPGIHFIASTHMDEPERFVPWQRANERVLESGSVIITTLLNFPVCGLS